MADVRALLKAKRQEVRINHPYASYNASGQLKCTMCETLVKHASAWEGHLGSKAHRTNVIRIRELERRNQEEFDNEMAVDDVPPAPEPTAKRKSPDDLREHPSEKKRKVGKESNTPKGFPDDFFSNPLHAPILLSEESDDEEGDNATADGQLHTAPPGPQNAVDLEYELFQRELMNATEDTSERFQRATIAAEPVVASTHITGFPSTTEAEVDEPPQHTEEEVRRQREQEDRELIMDRLLEEERAQEDADTRVLLLKNKVELLRKKREAARALKAKSSG